MMQEASKGRCNKIKFISLSFVSKSFSQKILIKILKMFGNMQVFWTGKGIMLFVTILWLCSKLKPSYIYIKTTLNGIVINSELAILPDKLCCIWAATRDLKQRKLNYPLNYQYGIDLKIDRKPFHVVLLILLAGDVTTNPGPLSSAPRNRTVNCLSLNARSLTSLHRTNTSEAEICTPTWNSSQI